MSDMHGHCLCGTVQVGLSETHDAIEICQCSMCRRWSGGFYSALKAGDAVIKNEDHATIFRSSDWAERAFCSTCGSHLWFHFLPTGHRSFSGGLFKDAEKLSVSKEIFADEAAAWCRLSGDHPRLNGEQVIEEAKAAGFTFD